MSTHENKVAAVLDFLRNRASLRRLTSHEEVQRAAGQILAARGQRNTSAPVARDKIIAVLAEIDESTVMVSGFMPSALVVHFWDNEPGHRFFERAEQLFGAEVAQDKAEFYQGQLDKAYAKYEGHVYFVDMEPEVPNDISELEEESSDW